jgi:hypothetical protein
MAVEGAVGETLPVGFVDDVHHSARHDEHHSESEPEYHRPIWFGRTVRCDGEAGLAVHLPTPERSSGRFEHLRPVADVERSA